MVICHDSEPGSPRESVFIDPSSHRFGHPAEFGVRATLDVIVPLDLESDVIGPALRAFDKTIVESGHESCGIYTKNILTAECAEITGKSRNAIPGVLALSAFSAMNDFPGLVLKPVRRI
jgi:hypothetical protein